MLERIQMRVINQDSRDKEFFASLHDKKLELPRVNVRPKKDDSKSEKHIFEGEQDEKAMGVLKQALERKRAANV